MPKFEPIALEDHVAAKLSPFCRAYLTAAEFTSSVEGPGEDDWGYAVWSADAITQAIEECGAFYLAHRDDIEDYGVTDAGHDLWMTRNGHGVGFWEEDHGTPESCARLDAAAKALGEVNAYVGDDGLAYFEGA